jgi:single-strand DNA-binding protein
MASVNKVMLLGNLTRDPELRYTPQGAAVCEFALALNRVYTNKQSGQRVEEVHFVDIVAWGRTAELCAEYLKKGRQAFVEGRLTQDRWESPEGKKMSKLRVTAEAVTFVGSRPPGDAPKGAAAPSEPAAAEEAAPPAGDEDIPF